MHDDKAMATAARQRERHPIEEVLPFGWYQVAWSHEVPEGAIHSMRYFGAALIAFRDSGGSVRVLDAHCPHLGAHLGVGGVVDGDTVMCPWHGWTWDGQGNCASVPYLDRPMRKRTRAWHAREVDDTVLVWYHPHGAAPSFEVPPFWSTEECGYLPVDDGGTHIWADETILPAVPAENLVDFAHFKWVHQAATIAQVESVQADGPVFRSVLSLMMGAGFESTWATPEGPVKGMLSTETWGPATCVVRFRLGEHPIDDVVVAMSTTPVDASPGASDLRITTYVPTVDPMGRDRDVNQLARRWYQQEVSQVAQDVPIWSNLQYTDKAPLVGDEIESFRAMREWADAFYLVAEEV